LFLDAYGIQYDERYVFSDWNESPSPLRGLVCGRLLAGVSLRSTTCLCSRQPFGLKPQLMMTP
jgi:hypothetical protein